MMIEFEGFNLVDPEKKILDRQPKHIAYVIGDLMKMFGAKKGSVERKTSSIITDKQRKGIEASISGLSEDRFVGAGDYTQGFDADKIDPYSKLGFEQQSRLQDERRLSLSDTGALRMQAAAASQAAAPDIAALRAQARDVEIPYQERLAAAVRRGREDLGRADIAARRRPGAQYGSAAEEALTKRVGTYGETVARTQRELYEGSEAQRLGLARQALSAAGQLDVAREQTHIDALSRAGQLELGGWQTIGSDLAQRRQLAQRSGEVEAQQQLDIAGLGATEAARRNQFGIDSATLENQHRLQRLQALGQISGQQTQQTDTIVKKGSAGLLPGLIQAGATIAGNAFIPGPGGAVIGSSLGGAIAGGLSEEYTGGGAGLAPNWTALQLAAMRNQQNQALTNVQPTAWSPRTGTLPPSQGFGLDPGPPTRWDFPESSVIGRNDLYLSPLPHSNPYSAVGYDQ